MAVVLFKNQFSKKKTTKYFKLTLGIKIYILLLNFGGVRDVTKAI